MAKIIWLASYPKSGNTWMRALLTNYLNGSGEPAQINDFIGGPIASARFWFDEWVGVEASALSDEIIEELRPGVYRCMQEDANDPHFLKVHDAWQETKNGEPLFPTEVTKGVIYMIRNPLDLVASSANHWGTSLDKAVDRLCDRNAALARSYGSLSDQLRQYLSSWSGHVSSWLDQSGLSTCIVRYEDLRREPQKHLANVVRFSGLDYDEARIDAAVAFAEFARLQEQEQTSGFRERPLVSTGLFFRRGQAGGWRDELSENLVARVIESEGDMMRRFGFLDEMGRPL